MKTPKKSKPTTKSTDNQLTLDSLVRSVDVLTDISNKLQVKVSRLDSQLDALSRAVVPSASSPKPALKWYEQEPQPIEWFVCCDPTRLVLTPGTTLRYDNEVITTYDGVTIGTLNIVGHNIISNAIKQGDKVHVYLTTARKLGIKLGR